MSHRSVRAALLVPLVALLGSCGDPTAPEPVVVEPPAGTPTSMKALTGDAQTGEVATLLPVEFAVELRDSAGTPVPKARVVFYRVVGTSENPLYLPIDTVVTDGKGVAHLRWTLPEFAGGHRIDAIALGTPVPVGTTLLVWGRAGAPTAISGGIAATYSYAGTAPPAGFTVRDRYGNTVPGVRVDFALGATGGTLGAVADTTDSYGVATPSWILGSDTGVYTLTGSIGVASSTVTAHASTGAPARIIDLRGALYLVGSSWNTGGVGVRIVDAQDRPVPGVDVAIRDPLRSTFYFSRQTRANGEVVMDVAFWSPVAPASQYVFNVAAATLRADVVAPVRAPPAAVALVRAPAAGSGVAAAQWLPDSVSALVTAADGSPQEGHLVQFGMSPVNGNVSGDDYLVSVTTDARGIATAPVRTPAIVGPATIAASLRAFPAVRAAVDVGVIGTPAYFTLAVGAAHSCALARSKHPFNVAYCWGRSSSGQLGANATAARLSPTFIPAYYWSLYAVDAGGDETCLLEYGSNTFSSVPTTHCVGANDAGQRGVAGGASATPGTVPGVQDKVSVGTRHACALGPTVNCWGDNARGALGDGTTTSSLMATPRLPAGSVAASVAAGDGYSCAMLTDGQLWCWGRNDQGQLGDGTTTDRLVPVRVGGATLFDPKVLVAAGSAHACAVRADGALLCWGRNDRGQLGDGSTSTRLVPTPASQPERFVRVTAGGAHTCALTAAWTAWCWGANESGQAGTGSPSAAITTPTRVAGTDGFRTIDAGTSHTCAIRDTGGVNGHIGPAYCWGLNDEGQLGDGTTTNRSLPTPVAEFHP